VLNKDDIIQLGQNSIEEEAAAIMKLSRYVDEDFALVIQNILASKGRVVITGIGKSANIAHKIVATLNSTGTPAIFMHAADAIHGDLGMVQQEDLVICISKSGNTPEIKVLVPLLKSRGNTLVGLTANKESYLGAKSDFVLHAYVEKEACPNNLAPTTSTTAQLVMGDALAICLLKAKEFTDRDFAKYHPGGSLGKKLYLKVNDLLSESKPQVSKESSIKEVILEISKNRLGATAVIELDQVVGVITDGDIRRMLELDNDWKNLKAEDIMNKNPRMIESQELAAEALEIIETNNISQLLVSKEGKYHGIIHMHDIIKEGIL
jgi:arabinose-5-phosphate isomerase